MTRFTYPHKVIKHLLSAYFNVFLHLMLNDEISRVSGTFVLLISNDPSDHN